MLCKSTVMQFFAVADHVCDFLFIGLGKISFPCVLYMNGLQFHAKKDTWCFLHLKQASTDENLLFVQLRWLELVPSQLASVPTNLHLHWAD